ncbi:hypothetical protein Ahy_A09g042010 [Arachis hypogaea]|uniref:Uncharacterized protein n=1 Tax=Arachis hypogaea TaxID=3818 RepID=A0A445BEI5_ARAHY|nr:hypothetical protein Ahy_A09g042010 [Arachis hypogaea]
MSNILYRNPVIVFDGLIQFDIIPIIDEANMQHMFHIHQQTQVQNKILRCKSNAEEIQHDSDMKDDKVEDFETTYEIGEKDEDGDVECETIVKNVVVPPTVSQPMDVLHFMRGLDLDAIHAPEFTKYANIGIANPRTGGSELKWNTILKKWSSRGVDYNMFMSPSHIRSMQNTRRMAVGAMGQASLIKKKIRRYNGSHTYIMGMISNDHSKLDSNTVAEVIRPLVETDSSVKVKSIITEVQLRFNYTINYRKAWLIVRKNLTKFCHRGSKHIDSNFLRKIKAPYLQKFIVNVGYSKTVDEYNINYKSVVIDLARRMYDCGHFEVERLTYRHIIAYCTN